MTNSRLMLYFSAIGLSQGLVWGLLVEYLLDTGPLTTGHYWMIALTSGISLLALNLLLGWERITQNRFVLGVVGLALVHTLVVAFWLTQTPETRPDYTGDSYRLGSWCGYGFAANLAALALLQTWCSPGPWRTRFTYAHWFDWSWHNVATLVIAGVFTGLAAMIYFLWLALLGFIGLEALSEFLEENPVPAAVIGAAYGYGLVLTRIQTRFVTSFRDIITSAASMLLVVVGIFMLIVLVSFPVVGLGMLWSTSQATPILLSLTVWFVLALAFMRGGDRMPPYPAWLRHAVEVMIALLPIFPALAIYSTWLRVDQYGLTPDRLWALLISSVLTIYALGIAVALVRRHQPWLYLAGHASLALAAISLPLVVAMHTPWLDPMRLSANNQVHRVLSGKVPITALDLETLRGRWGGFGWEAFQELQRIEDHPLADEIRNHVEKFVAAIEAGQPWSSDTTLVGRSHIEPSRPGMVVPDGVWLAIEESSSWLQYCRQEERRCLIFAADIATFPTDATTGPQEEYCVLLDRWAAYQRDHSLCYGSSEAGHWHVFGRLIIPETVYINALEESLALGGPETKEAPYRQLEFGEHTVNVVSCCDQMPEWWHRRR